MARFRLIAVLCAACAACAACGSSAGSPDGRSPVAGADARAAPALADPARLLEAGAFFYWLVPGARGAAPACRAFRAEKFRTEGTGALEPVPRPQPWRDPPDDDPWRRTTFAYRREAGRLVIHTPRVYTGAQIALVSTCEQSLQLSDLRWFEDLASCEASRADHPPADLGACRDPLDDIADGHRGSPALARLLERGGRVHALERHGAGPRCVSWRIQPDADGGFMTARVVEPQGAVHIRYEYALGGEDLTLLGPSTLVLEGENAGSSTDTGDREVLLVREPADDHATVGGVSWYFDEGACERHQGDAFARRHAVDP